MVVDVMRYGTANHAGDAMTALFSIGGTNRYPATLFVSNGDPVGGIGIRVIAEGILYTDGTGTHIANSYGVYASANTIGVHGSAEAPAHPSAPLQGTGVRGWGHQAGVSGFCPSFFRPDGREEIKNFSAGVIGTGQALNSSGVIGEANNGSSAAGVRGISSSGWAGFFEGAVAVVGQFTKSAGGFKIDHPLDPENKYLYHSFVESPDMLNVYSGNVTTDEEGNATVSLPNYFEELNQDFRYQLTVIGNKKAHAVIGSEVSDNQFSIITDRSRVKVSWQVSGVRKDAFAMRHRMPVEEEKPPDERGTFLHAEAVGEPVTRALGNARTEMLRSYQEEIAEFERAIPDIERSGPTESD